MQIYTSVVWKPRLLLQASNQSLTLSSDAVLELLLVLGLPVGTRLARDGSSALECNVKNILAAVALVAIEALVGEAELAKSQRGLACEGAAVGVAPDAIELEEVG